MARRIEKRILVPERVRLLRDGFSWIDGRFVCEGLIESLEQLMDMAAREREQTFDFVPVMHQIRGMPAADQLHDGGDDDAERGDREEGRHADACHAGVERAECEDAGLLVEVLDRDLAARAHQVVAAMLKQCVHWFLVGQNN